MFETHTLDNTHYTRTVHIWSNVHWVWTRFRKHFLIRTFIHRIGRKVNRLTNTLRDDATQHWAATHKLALISLYFISFWMRIVEWTCWCDILKMAVNYWFGLQNTFFLTDIHRSISLFFLRFFYPIPNFKNDSSIDFSRKWHSIHYPSNTLLNSKKLY